MTVSRRSILKGASFGAGSLVLSPILSQLEAEAKGHQKKPTRFVFVLEGNGLPWKQIQPVGIARKKQHQRDEIVVQSLKKHAMAKALEPLTDYRERVSIIQGLSGKIAGGGHSNDFGALGAYNCSGGVGNSGAPQGETIDVTLGKKLGGIFKQVGLGISDRPAHSVIYNCSAWDRGKAMPTQCRPDLAYGSLFGSVASGAARQEFQAKTNVLDFLREDVKKLRNQVAGPEREKLDAHLHAYEAMRDRQSRLNDIKMTLRKHAPVVSDKYKSEVETDRLDAHFDLAAASLIGGLTNVVTLASGVGNPYFSVKFTGLGIDFGKHGIGHGGKYKNWTAEDMGIIIRRFHFDLIARLMKKLDAVPEGDGTMLDNTLIVYLSDAAEGHHSRCWEWPFVVIGNLGGRLKTGQYVEYPYWGKKGHREIGNLYTTFLHAIGDRRKYYGVQDANLSHLDQDGPLKELLV